MSERPTVAEAADLGEVPYLRPHPGAALFARRAERLDELSEGHALRELLRFCGWLSAAQSVAFPQVRVAPEPRERPARFPLAAASPPDEGWIVALRAIAAVLDDAPMPVEACAALDRLAVVGDEELAVLAGAILAREFAGLDPAEVPFAAAALQVQFAAWAARVPPAGVGRTQRGCPLCGSAPVAGLVLGDGLRRLECSLCGSRWHLAGASCAYCGASGAAGHLHLDGDGGEAEAETCGRCGRYVKLFHLDRRPAAQPAADDLATRPLDGLAARAGFVRYGVNLLLPG